MIRNNTSLHRRRVLGGIVGMSGLSSMVGCHAPGPVLISTPRKYDETPAMMAIGDSLYQGVRSLTFTRDMGRHSPPAQIADALGEHLVTPDPDQPFLFDIEHIYRTEPLLLTAPLNIRETCLRNMNRWLDSRQPWSVHQAFDNVAIGGARIESLYTDTFRVYWPKVTALRDLIASRATDAASLRAHFQAIADLWYALSVCFTLNPLHRDEQADRTQIDQVAHRKPRRLLVNIGSNEGLFHAAFLGQVEGQLQSLQKIPDLLGPLGDRLAALPREVETIVFNSLVRPRTAPNLMPATEDGQVTAFPGAGYFDAYGSWLFQEHQPVSASTMRRFDEVVRDVNDRAYRVLRSKLGANRLRFVDLYAASDRLDGKHYQDRVVSIGQHALRNTPLVGFGSVIRSGGLAGLDNLHPSVPGYAVIADAVLAALGSPVMTNKSRAFGDDTLLTNVPILLKADHKAIIAAASLIEQLGRAGVSSQRPSTSV